MIRGAIGQSLDHDPDFRWRGQAVTRIENLSDIVFALALGMLISGVDAPRNLPELNSFLFSIVPTAAGFAVLLGIWHGHYTFFRRYGVADKTIIFLNAVLIFFILFMAYPLRFAFDSLFGFIVSLFTGDYSRNMNMGITSFRDSGKLVGYFALAYAVTFAIMAMMTAHVLKAKDQLALSAYEIAKTQQLRFARWGQFAISFLTAMLAFFSPIHSMAGAILSLFFIAFFFAERRYPATRASGEQD